MKILKNRLQVKPLSANKMFWKRGRATIKTADYLAFQNDIRDQLMDVSWPFGSELVSFKVDVAFSNRNADLDNAIKPILDTYQSIFDDFNDNKVWYIELIKHIVPKGDEYLNIEIQERNLDED